MLRPLFAFACPVCRQPLVEAPGGRFRCSAHRVEVASEGGIWRLSSAESTADGESFLADYRRLRRDEGWGTDDPAYFRALPFRDTTGRHREVWRIRAASYELLRRRVLDRQELSVVDLGAGNGWLSWRLAESGHQVAAVDLSDDATDGLGAARLYLESAELQLVQAGFDAIPFADGSFDLAVFNGSLHYSNEYGRTLAEAGRLLRSAGSLVIMDSPLYRRAASGERMVRERRRTWQELYGPGFGESRAEAFLTRRRLREIGASQGWQWRIHPLSLGWRWHLGPWVSMALGRREPARFPLIVGRRPQSR